jgi:hypothetical protein
MNAFYVYAFGETCQELNPELKILDGFPEEAI